MRRSTATSLAALWLTTAAPAQSPASTASAFRANAQHTGAFDAPGVPQLNGLVWKYQIEGR
ncbi:MAG TPA: hypothetical protein VJZ25_09440 [Gemmatimonadaceae bacterium]|nr:hypothetical protein [Gemmatimonadaceae bacterium]